MATVNLIPTYINVLVGYGIVVDGGRDLPT